MAQLWPNICVAGAQIAKDTVEPILATTLPGPLSSLKFVKLDLGQVPIRFSNVDVHKSTAEGIKLDMDMEWESVCDIELDGARVPKIVRKTCFFWSGIALYMANHLEGYRKGPSERQTIYTALPIDEHHPLGNDTRATLD